jgi:hypothetical protein
MTIQVHVAREDQDKIIEIISGVVQHRSVASLQPIVGTREGYPYVIIVFEHVTNVDEVVCEAERSGAINVSKIMTIQVQVAQENQDRIIKIVSGVVRFRTAANSKQPIIGKREDCQHVILVYVDVANDLDVIREARIGGAIHVSRV